jgi:hypothetical protein
MADKAPLQVYAARVGSRDPDALDVTRKSGNPAFAPSLILLRPYLELRRAGRETQGDWERYVQRYTEEMRLSYRRNRAPWNEVLSRGRVVLCCYCVDPERCHRTVLGRDILTTFGAQWLGELQSRAAAQRGLFDA